jgi:dihydroorotase
LRSRNTGEVVLDREDAERLSKLIEWAAQFVISIEHITVQEAAQFVRDWNALTGMAPLIERVNG